MSPEHPLKNSFKLHLVKNRFDLDLVVPSVGRTSQVVILLSPPTCELLLVLTQGNLQSRSREASGPPSFAFLEDLCTSDGSFDL